MRIHRIATLATGFVALLASPIPSRADLLVNGGFENPVQSAGAGSLFTPGQVVGSGWTTVGNSGTNVLLLQTTYAEPNHGVNQFNAEEGLNSLDLSGGGNVGTSAGVEQSVATVLGMQYTLSFYVGNATPSSGPGGYYTSAAIDDLSINGGSRNHFTNSNTTNGMVNWEQFSYVFTATGPSTTIDFYNGTSSGAIGSGTNFVGLDNVSLTAVPGPASILLFGTAIPILVRLRASKRKVS